ncbi:MAG: SAM-dependent chlorinase/fluorinase [Trueperaceae bacterium]|nr:SAM-dependent chlorinase/fluorinase [Trueperaceae bacterium]
MQSPTAPLFLLSDFGLRDAYVGVMRAVVAGLAPRSAVHDLLHELPPQDLTGARIQLAAALPWLPDGAVVCAVVDPGVGTDRHAIVVRAAHPDGRGLWAVAPDNGLLTMLLRDDRAPYASAARAQRAWRIDPAALAPRGPGTTFDGRDLFAPAAARLARGDDADTLGEQVGTAQLTTSATPELTHEGDAWTGRVVWIDRFGDLVSDVPADRLPSGRWVVRVAGRSVPGPAAGFASVAPGEPVAYLGSLGTVEVALRDGDAASAWAIPRGTELRVSPA